MTNATKTQLRALFARTLAALDLAVVLPSRVHVALGTRRTSAVLTVDEVAIDLATCRHVSVFAFGKAALPMAAFLAPLLQPFPHSGIVVVPHGTRLALDLDDSYRVVPGGHPLPDADSFAAAGAVLAHLRERTTDDLVVFLLSGGGSAMLEQPIDPSITVDDCAALYRTLVTCGAGIVDVNVVRKHLSAVKGGRLAAAAAPARQLTLFVSDVPREHPDAVASGPTMPDRSNVNDARGVVAPFAQRLPDSVRRVLAKAPLSPTANAGDSCFARSSWHCVLDSNTALAAVEAAAAQLGWVIARDTTVDDLPLERAADHLLARLDSVAAQHPGRTVCVATAGELSVAVTGDGVGGRNQAFALYCAQRVRGQPVTVLSAGTDGIDGNSPAAGAVADGDTIPRALRAGRDPAAHYRRSDAYPLFAALGDAIVTGPTGTNVRDVRVVVRHR